ncbi:MAG: CDP-alcohol phosphatidyltransferase family protein [Bacteroidetes bacterium]|nr:CDP-alcohol phosphatidyltransferase family protein [Bacteroidota bacterium]MBU1678389.1 CDP-alcohol phosphatidyltransferase family protein [Bacteroidota bacterium]MBU2508632.1 CDP-alcohol phosphatidyltransferase family protein [Bacteroidota bacterium]
MTLKEITSDKIFTYSNLLSFFRILLAFPIIVLLDRIHTDDINRYYVVAIFFLVFLTDIGDGYLARKLNQVTEFGKIIDPLADKILAIIIITKLYFLGEISTFLLLVIIIRDVLIFIAGVLLSIKIKRVLPSNLLGKATIFTIGLYLILLVLNIQMLAGIVNILYYLVIILSFVSLLGYALRAYETIKWQKNESN